MNGRQTGESGSEHLAHSHRILNSLLAHEVFAARHILSLRSHGGVAELRKPDTCCGSEEVKLGEFRLSQSTTKVFYRLRGLTQCESTTGSDEVGNTCSPRHLLM